jgi:hypothetical protein
MDPFRRERGQSDSVADSLRYSHSQSQQRLPPFRTVSRKCAFCVNSVDDWFSFFRRMGRRSRIKSATMHPAAMLRLQQHLLDI